MKAYPHPPGKSIDFGAMITDAWRLIWRHKFLWFFGLFAGGSTSLGGWSCNFQSGGDSGQENGARRTGETGGQIGDWINSHITLLIIIIAALVVLFLLLWLWSIICRGAVISSVRDTAQGREIGFGSAFARGRESFRRLLLFDLFLILLGFCLIIIAAAIILFIIFLVMMAGLAGKVILSLLGLWLLTFLGFGLGYFAICTLLFSPWLFFGIIYNFAIRAVILEGERPMAAFRRGWRVAMDNLVQALLMFLVSVGLGIGASIAMVMAVGISAIPAAIAWIFAYNQGWPPATIIIASILVILPLAALILAAAAMNTFFTTYWTMGYDRLTGNVPAG